jgi:hypothetical protein
MTCSGSFLRKLPMPDWYECQICRDGKKHIYRREPAEPCYPDNRLAYVETQEQEE